MMSVDLPRGYWFDSLDSTMDEARRLIQAGQIEGAAFVVARHQTQGRGTQGRKWSSPEGQGIYLSIIHVPTTDTGFEATPIYTLAAGVASVEALKLTTGLKASLKPINDIYVEGKKLGGILVESELRHQGLATLITGIGINIRQTEHELDRTVVPPVSLQELLPSDAFAALDPDVLVETLVAKVCFWYALIFNGQHGQVERAWENYKLTPG